MRVTGTMVSVVLALAMTAGRSAASQVTINRLEEVLPRTKMAFVATVDSFSRINTEESVRINYVLTPKSQVIGDMPFQTNAVCTFSMVIPLLRDSSGKVVGHFSYVSDSSGTEFNVETNGSYVFMFSVDKLFTNSPTPVFRIEPAEKSEVILSLANRIKAGKLSENPFNIELVKGVEWEGGKERFDWELTGYRLSGGIGVIRLSSRKGVEPPSKLVLSIATTIGMRAHCESLTVESKDRRIEAEMKDGKMTGTRLTTLGSDGLESSAENNADAGLTVGVDENRLKVVFSGKSLEMLKDGGTVRWIDWFRR